MSLLSNGRQCLYQWDKNQKIILDDHPESTEIHFYLNRPGFITKSSPDVSEAARVIAYENNGHKYADIPNDLLQEYGELYVYFCTSNEDEFYTSARSSIKVQSREKPSGYVYTDSSTSSLTWGDLRGDNE